MRSTECTGPEAELEEEEEEEEEEATGNLGSGLGVVLRAESAVFLGSAERWRRPR
jgi:hypothetical protein